MKKISQNSEVVRQYALEHVATYPKNIASRVSEHFGMSRQAANKHIQRLVEEGLLRAHGATRNRRYELCTLTAWTQTYPLDGLDEAAVWDADITRFTDGLARRVEDIWHYGFTEMLNNAIDHSDGKAVFVRVTQTAVDTEIHIFDDGVGIFKKIQRAKGLADAHHAAVELAKGRFTTDPANHTGEGIFFSSRVFNRFYIVSGDICFSHQKRAKDDWEYPTAPFEWNTCVAMKLTNRTRRRLKSVFDRFAPEDDDYTFNRTIIPVRLAQHGDGRLVSRSQAKRLLNDLDRFEIVTFDFEGVAEVGQAFADEIFRVFQSRHPRMEVRRVNAGRRVEQMITRALAQRKTQ